MNLYWCITYSEDHYWCIGGNIPKVPQKTLKRPPKDPTKPPESPSQAPQNIITRKPTKNSKLLVGFPLWHHWPSSLLMYKYILLLMKGENNKSETKLSFPTNLKSTMTLHDLFSLIQNIRIEAYQVLLTIMVQLFYWKIFLKRIPITYVNYIRFS